MMKRLYRAALTMLVTASLLMTTVYAADSGAGEVLSSIPTNLAPGLTYYERVYGAETSEFQAGYSLELAPDSSVYPIIMACDTIWGGLTATECIEYAQSLGYNVVAAVNADFFNSSGVPIGIVMEDGEFESGNVEENTFAIMSDGSFSVSENPTLQFTLENDSNGVGPYRLTRLNKKFGGNSLYLYTSDFSTVSTRVTTNVWAVRLKVMEGSLSLTDTVTLMVTDVIADTTAEYIGEGYMILTASNSGTNAELYQEFTPGDMMTLSATCSDSTLKDAAYISGCGDILIADGAITDQSGWSTAIGGVHPRTLWGWKADGTLVMTVIDGRQRGYSLGITLRQAAEEMLRQGCVYAVNMDGGGSSTMAVRLPGSGEETVVNSPSDGGQRRCGSWMLLVTDQARDGQASNLHLRENGLLVAAGQQLELHAFATDSALFPARLKETVTFAAESGTVADGIYTAPAAQGLDTVTLHGDTLEGTGYIQVVSDFTKVRVTNRYGRTVDAVTLRQGQQLDLEIDAWYNREQVLADGSAITYEMSANLGTVDENGVFTAAGLPGMSGDLTVHLGDYSHTIHITIAEGYGLSVTAPTE